MTAAPAASRGLPFEEAARRVDEARGLGRRVVLANGAFDLLHVGHLRYLEGARAEGDFLVVAVNSDASVRRLKGPDRPIFPESERLELVAALGVVDAAFLFGEDSVADILRRLRPHVHAKGTDYTPDTVPERRVAEEVGARTVITGDPKDHASSDILRRLGRRP
jgi:D-glycero-beta-D-manno-heptose 1-phosphate adenylyltransferase